MKKVFAMILSLVLVLSLATTAFAASITIDPNVPTGGSDTAETYNAYKIFDATISGTNVSYTIDSKEVDGAATNPFYTVVAGLTDYFTLDEINDTGVYNVTFKGTGAEAEAIAIANALNAVIGSVTADATVNSQTEGKYVLSGLDTGYYLVTSSLGTKLVLDTLSDIEVDTKNEYPSVTKDADKQTAAYDEVVTYTVKVDIPASAEGEMKVHDTMTGLTFQAMDTTNTTTGITKNDSACAGHTVCFTIPQTVVAANLGKEVVIVYTAKVDANTAIANNEVILTYSSFTSVKDTENVENTKFDVYKYTMNGENKEGLTGAGFVLMNSESKYYNLTDGKVSWVDSIESATELEPAADNSYTVTFEGLAAGTYTLIESTVPDGYNKADDTTITIEYNNDTEAFTINNQAEGEANIKFEIVNNTGSELPSTGGIGTTLFYIIGATMMLGAAVLLITKKRVSNV